MQVGNNLHLTYCTNIHPGETWQEIFSSLKFYINPIKQKLCPDQAFGIGLRLSNIAAQELLEESRLQDFITWLKENNLYVFTMNGFPYGTFHRDKVKDDVHKPDWTTTERLTYIENLSKILSRLLPEGMDGGISTSPLSYKPWFKNDPQKIEEAFRKSTLHLAQLTEKLIKLKAETGKVIHIDIEPEPDGLIENNKEVLEYFSNWLLPSASKYLQTFLGLNKDEAEKAIKEHIRVCYDVCHYAVAYEDHQEALEELTEAGIKIGKFQISAALKAGIPKDPEQRQLIADKFRPFVESTYLHQVVEIDKNKNIFQFPDLPKALEALSMSQAVEWRVHFHVPIFMEKYSLLESTQKDILEVLKLAKTQNYTNHLEVETYTWEVLPPEERLDLTLSIQRELDWVKNQLGA
ncbi:metabolite traffic protein EboE [soil metagenome]